MISSLLTKRLAGKSMSEMKHFVLSGTLKPFTQPISMILIRCWPVIETQISHVLLFHEDFQRATFEGPSLKHDAKFSYLRCSQWWNDWKSALVITTTTTTTVLWPSLFNLCAWQSFCTTCVQVVVVVVVILYWQNDKTHSDTQWRLATGHIT